MPDQKTAMKRHQRQRRQFMAGMEAARGGVYNTARVAIHELGHSAILWFHEAAGAFEEVTVVPTAQYDGLTTSTWKVQKTRAEMRASIATDLGGRCAEEYFFGESIGHVSDESEWKKMAMKVGVELLQQGGGEFGLLQVGGDPELQPVPEPPKSVTVVGDNPREEGPNCCRKGWRMVDAKAGPSEPKK
uniref:Peptidase_M41 domain-containing protein n=1 Tax=Globodera pallida TaxID=36090 RepID=A0A183BPF0_GLOPA